MRSITVFETSIILKPEEVYLSSMNGPQAQMHKALRRELDSSYKQNFKLQTFKIIILWLFFLKVVSGKLHQAMASFFQNH